MPSVTAGYDNGAAMPSTLCTSRFSSIYTALVISLLVDIGMQVRAHGMSMVDFTYPAVRCHYQTLMD